LACLFTVKLFYSFINASNVVRIKVTKSIFALWSLEVAGILCNCVLIMMAIWILYQKHLTKFDNVSDAGVDDEKLHLKLIALSRWLLWFALLSAMLSSVQWVGTAFSFSIGRYMNEICAGMDQGSPTYRNMQSFIFDPPTCVQLLTIALILMRRFIFDVFFRANYLASCASTSGNNRHMVIFDAPLSAMIDQLSTYNLSSEYNFSGVVNQIHNRMMQIQSAAMVKSNLTLATALDHFSNYGKYISSYLSHIKLRSGINCFWGNITLCRNCPSCTIKEEQDFVSKRDDLITVEPFIVGINDAIQREAAESVEFVQAAKLDQIALQNFRMAVVNEVRKSSDAVHVVAAFLKNEWECLGANNALPLHHHHDFQMLMCGINSKSAASIVQISCQCFMLCICFKTFSR
jgi:hypothetical protein